MLLVLSYALPAGGQSSFTVSNTDRLWGEHTREEAVTPLDEARFHLYSICNLLCSALAIPGAAVNDCISTLCKGD